MRGLRWWQTAVLVSCSTPCRHINVTESAVAAEVMLGALSPLRRNVVSLGAALLRSTLDSHIVEVKTTGRVALLK